MAVSCPLILWWLQTFWDLQELLCTPVWKQPFMPLTNTKEKGFAFRMWIRPHWLRGGKWRGQAPAQRHGAAPVRAPARPPPIPMAKRHPPRHCSPATPQTAVTRIRSSSSRTECCGTWAVVANPYTLLPSACAWGMFCALKRCVPLFSLESAS